ncbi:hypothetical protein NQ314_014823 [Rhamnusium bicolor]|uniref:Zinc finger CCHC domain-containing protein 4 n=1 Tax=Rhamnusium bicolor TaxID=1586634 RepID=A0AAV8X011_9CUCU|nr:hypothetical protein NQ314_014823 [Rhamnusium bicolor]
MTTKGSVEVITENLESHPHCPHGPTILFSREVKGKKRNFFACSACRDRKHCNFFLWEDERNKLTKFKKRKLFLIMNQIRNLSPERRIYCHICSEFVLENFENKHTNHSSLKGISNYQLDHPSEILPALEDTKKEAQYLFSKASIETLVNIFKTLGYKNVICIGTPRIHEYIRSSCEDMNSILLDIDCRFHNFFGPLEYCWYNMFNDYFFFNEAKTVFEDFLKCNRAEGMVLIIDPPFGGRVEPLAFTLNKLNHQYKSLNKLKKDLPIFWIFPYFMEPQILNSLSNFRMLDYKVEYDNHLLFQDGPKGRKQGSPVRIFTNVNPSLIRLPDNGYTYCRPCNRWVSEENNHCDLCNSCTSKDGRTYVHCSTCMRCVKPTWKHCKQCGRCAQVEHKCDCFHCKESGHKKSECPLLKQLSCKKRKNHMKKNKSKKMRK